VVPKGAGSDVRDAEMRARNPCMDGVPLGAVAELSALAAHVDRQLPGTAAPALVLAGGHDHTVTVSGARRLARRIGSGPAELIVLPESWHLVGIDVERERCAGLAVDFLARLPVPGSRRRAPAARAGAKGRAAAKDRREPGDRAGRGEAGPHRAGGRTGPKGPGPRGR
jgi:carboxylesterase